VVGEAERLQLCWVFCSAVEAAVQVSYLAPVVLVSAVGRLSPHSIVYLTFHLFVAVTWTSLT